MILAISILLAVLSGFSAGSCTLLLAAKQQGLLDE